MTFNRLIIAIAIVAPLALVLYPLIAKQWLRDPITSAAPSQSAPTSLETGKNVIEPSAALPPESAAGTATARQARNDTTGSRLIEIFGRVVDQHQQPIEDVLITEERYFYFTRSDAGGNYRLLLDMPRHRLPTLHFLRHGFSGKRIRPDKTQLQRKPVLELDLELEDNPDSVKLSGWVGNETGVALEAVRVELTALETDDANTFFLTVFTDASGHFDLDGVPAGKKYKLLITPASAYQGYRNDDLLVSANPGEIDIVLSSLKMVDIDGMILNHESAPVADFEIQISNLTTGTHRRKLVSDASGFFSLRGFPLGAVSLTTSLSAQGAEYFRISGLTLTDNEYRNLILIVDKGSHHLSGWISDNNGIAVAKAMVTLEARVKNGPIEYLSYRSQSSDPNGRFAFTGIGGVEHRLSVYANGFDKQALLHRFNAQSDEIRVRLVRQD
jgi:hypothetical protein